MSNTIKISLKNKKTIRVINMRIVCRKKQIEISCFFDKIIEIFTMFGAHLNTTIINTKKKK